MINGQHGNNIAWIYGRRQNKKKKKHVSSITYPPQTQNFQLQSHIKHSYLFLPQKIPSPKAGSLQMLTSSPKICLQWGVEKED